MKLQIPVVGIATRRIPMSEPFDPVKEFLNLPLNQMNSAELEWKLNAMSLEDAKRLFEEMENPQKPYLHAAFTRWKAWRKRWGTALDCLVKLDEEIGL
jgi:hypothetical protein